MEYFSEISTMQHAAVLHKITLSVVQRVRMCILADGYHSERLLR